MQLHRHDDLHVHARVHGRGHHVRVHLLHFVLFGNDHDFRDRRDFLHREIQKVIRFANRSVIFQNLLNACKITVNFDITELFPQNLKTCFQISINSKSKNDLEHAAWIGHAASFAMYLALKRLPLTLLNDLTFFL